MSIEVSTNLKHQNVQIFNLSFTLAVDQFCLFCLRKYFSCGVECNAKFSSDLNYWLDPLVDKMFLIGT